MGPLIIFDKSALQALSVDESCWLDRFFISNITPLFYVETLADLEKPQKGKRTAAEIVGEIAYKTPVESTVPNTFHESLVLQDLLGNAVPMNQQAVLSGGQTKRDEDGNLIIHFREFPEMAAMQRWQDGKFEEIELEAARGWRNYLKNLNFDSMIEWVGNTISRATRFKSLGEVKKFADDFVHQQDETAVNFMLQFLEVPSLAWPTVIERHRSTGGPPLAEFAPYASYVLRVDIFFYTCLLMNLLSKERTSNKIDIAYLYYLPFCMAFVSADKLHAKTAPLFSELGQEFVDGLELKESLSALDEHYSQFAEEIERVGIVQYAPYPPKDMDNVVTRLWDKFCTPWRRHDDERRRSGATSRSPVDLIERLNAVTQQDPTDEVMAGPREADAMLLEHRVPLRRGKWRVLPPEVESPSSQETAE
jgi:hypothetical protein